MHKTCNQTIHNTFLYSTSNNSICLQLQSFIIIVIIMLVSFISDNLIWSNLFENFVLTRSSCYLLVASRDRGFSWKSSFQAFNQTWRVKVSFPGSESILDNFLVNEWDIEGGDNTRRKFWMIKFKDFSKGRTSIFTLIDKCGLVMDRYEAVTFEAVPFGHGLMELIDKNVRGRMRWPGRSVYSKV